jgi:flagellar export protein FliJ
MKPFRLSSLLRVRRFQEDRAAAELARSNVESHKAHLRRELLDRTLAGSEMPDQADSVAFRSAVAARAAASVAAADARNAQQVAEASKERAQETWTEAHTRNTTLSKLAERHVEEQQREELRLEQHVLDEIGSRRATEKAAADEDTSTDPAASSPTPEDQR